MRHHLGLSFLALLVTTPASAQQRLSPAERRVAAEVDRAVPDALSVLERAVNINSGSMNLAGVREVGRVFAEQFEALGFSTSWVDGTAWQRAGHLLAERRGLGTGPRLLLIGHLDTVFESDSPFQRFERLPDSTARGPGVIDMKGGNVVMLLALRALLEASLLDRLQIKVVLIGDEEDSGRPLELSRRDLRDAADWADVALGFEDGDGDPRTAVIGRRGWSGWTLRTASRAAHSSLIFREDVGAGSIFEAARILSEFRETLASEPDLSFSPGLILGGTTVALDQAQSRGTAFGKSNVIAESTIVTGDLRALTPQQLERAKATMRGIVSRHLPRTSASLDIVDSYPPLAPTDGNRRLLARFDSVSRDLGFGPVSAVDPGRAGAADISFTAGRVEMALDGIGLMGRDGHTVREMADLRTLPTQAKRVAVLMARMAR